jgi:1-acyl-sn-glycerol-3-phosphate acyltransferase
MPVPLPARRLMIPLLIVLELFLLLPLAMGAVIGLVASLADRRRRILRISVMGMTYIVIELLALISLALAWAAKPFRPRSWYDTVNLRILTVALGAILSAGRALVGFRIVVNDPPSLAPFDTNEPVVVLARHGGIGDSYALVWLLASRYRRRPRLVAKDILQWEPLLDVALNRMGACFLPRNAGPGTDLASRIETLARELAAGDALLLFPEGANWTPRRRSRAITRLHSNRKHETGRQAQLMENVLPARPGGVLACLRARPDIAVVVFAHTGLDKITTAPGVWQAIPFRAPMNVRWWPTLPAPCQEQERLDWLATEWAILDEWIDTQRDPDS